MMESRFFGHPIGCLGVDCGGRGPIDWKLGISALESCAHEKHPRPPNSSDFAIARHTPHRFENGAYHKIENPEIDITPSVQGNRGSNARDKVDIWGGTDTQRRSSRWRTPSRLRRHPRILDFYNSTTRRKTQ